MKGEESGKKKTQRSQKWGEKRDAGYSNVREARAGEIEEGRVDSATKSSECIRIIQAPKQGKGRQGWKNTPQAADGLKQEP